ncbi:hypothetical protein EPUL_006297, partial [Erysiphe pulchra]
NNNFLRCIRSRQAPKAPESDPHSKLFVPPPKTVFVCGKTFFDIEVLKHAAKIAKTQAGKVTKGQYPKECSGHPYYEPYLMWPLMRDGSLYKKGVKRLYRLILKPDYSVMSVAIWSKDKLIACDQKTIKANKDHDKSGYHCYQQRFSHEKLVIAAEEACKRMNDSKQYMYPARYEGPEFDSKGPYYTFPVLQNGDFKY